LQATDGWLYAGRFVQRLRGTSDIDWFRNLYPKMLERRRGAPEAAWKRLTALLSRALVLSAGGDVHLLLDPERLDSRGEWKGFVFKQWDAAPLSSRSFGGLVRQQYLWSHELGSPETASSEVLQMAALQAGNASRRGKSAAPLAELESLSVTGHPLTLCYLAQMRGMVQDWQAIPALVMPVLGEAGIEALGSNVFPEDLLRLLLRAERELSRPDLLPEATGRMCELQRRMLGVLTRSETMPEADWSAAIDQTFHERTHAARAQILSGRHEEAWQTIEEAIPKWEAFRRPMLAPTGLVTDSILSQVMTPERGRQILETWRGGWAAPERP
jgi:hypothetical protein